MPLSPLRRLAWLRVLVAAELLVAVSVTGGLWLLRQQTLEAESRLLSLVARAMALQADRTLDIGQTVLAATRDELTRGLIKPIGPDTDALLRERVRALPGIRAISVFDANGQRLATSRPPGQAPARAIAGRDFFEAARQPGQTGLYLSEPYVALGDGQPAVSLSMAWRDADGQFLGVVALVADPDFLGGGFQRIAGGADVQQALYRRTGTPLPTTALPQVPQPALASDRVRALLAPQPPDAMPSVLPLGPRQVLVVAAPLQALPLVQVVWRDVDAVLDGWTDLAWLVGAFMAAMLAVTSALGLRMARGQLRVQGLEQRLARSRKLEALGQLAGGVAHDFNNVLAAVVGFGEMARQSAAADSRQARHLDQVLQAAERGRQQVERIMAFSRGQPRRSLAFRLQPVVQEVLDHLSASLRAGVTVDADLRGPDLAVQGDPTSTYEAVMNLCTNALQAMADGGTLALSLHGQTLAAPLQLYDTTLPPGRYVRLVVRDSGTGMSPEVLARLFEPFFTTRGGHGGTGIGLAVVHGVVADMGGGIDVVSTPGRGTTFTVLLPAVQAPATAPVGQADEAIPMGQGQTVLVVDDEPALVELAEDLLADLGYEPLGSTSSQQALQAFQHDPARFDLLLTDEVMPDISGTALARAVHALRPDLPVVLASGYGGDQFDARAAEAGVHTVLSKPLTRRALARALHQALNQSQQQPLKQAAQPALQQAGPADLPGRRPAS